MTTEWDEAKNAANRAKHGLDFADFAGFDSPPRVIADSRQPYGEMRFRAFGRIDGLGHCLAFTLRGSAMRLISFRRPTRRKCAAMNKHLLPTQFDDDNPEWTEADFARARPADEVLPPEVVALLVRKPGRPAGSKNAYRKQQIALRVDADVLAAYKAAGRGWQTRMNDALRKGLENKPA